MDDPPQERAHVVTKDVPRRPEQHQRARLEGIPSDRRDEAGTAPRPRRNQLRQKPRKLPERAPARNPRGAHQHQPVQSLRPSSSNVDRDLAPHRVANEMRPLDPCRSIHDTSSSAICGMLG